jgi:hypothetical protein
VERRWAGLGSRKGRVGRRVRRKEEKRGQPKRRKMVFPFYTYRILRGISKRDFHKSLREIQMKFKMS